MINKITIDGLRGKSFALELGPVTLISGRNTAGKTTVADAIRFGLMGYLPSMPPPPRSWSELLLDGEASVSIENGNGEAPRVSRIYKNGKSVKIDAPSRVAGLNLLSLDASAFMEGTESQRSSMLAAASAGQLDWRSLVPSGLAEAHPISGYVSWQTWIDEAIDKETARLSEAKSERDMYTRTVRGLEQLRESVLPDEAEIEAEKKAIEARIIERKADLEGLHRAIAEAQKPRVQSPDERRLAELEAEMRPLARILVDQETLDSREIAVAKAMEALRVVGRPLPYPERQPLRSKATALEKAVSSTERTLEITEAKLGAIKGRYDALRASKKCPTCGCAGKALATAIDAVEEAERAEVQAELDRVRKKLVPLKKECVAAVEATAAAENLAADWSTAEAEQRALADERRLVSLRREADEVLLRVRAAEEAALGNGADELAIRRHDVTCELGDLEEERSNVATRKRNADHVRSQLRTLGEAETALKAAETAATGHNDVVKRLKDLREALTVATLQPVLDAMGAFTAGIFESPLMFDGADLGRFVGSRWVTFRQFSGMERAVATAALTCALRADSTHENIVICDELGTLDDRHLTAFLGNVVKAVKSGLVTQFVGLSTPRQMAAIDGVKELAL
jgi:DNA repair exonuclease SbcCD ATPase subunit